MSHHSIIAGLCFFLMMATFLVAMFRSVADTDRRKIVKSKEWFKCIECGVFECEDGRQQYAPPYSNIEMHHGCVRIRGYRVRECKECKAVAVQLAKASVEVKR